MCIVFGEVKKKQNSIRWGLGLLVLAQNFMDRAKF